METTVFNEKYDYINNEPINQGGYGEIYSIIDKKVKTEYILKKIKKEKSPENELNTLLNNSIPNLLKLFSSLLIKVKYIL